MNANVAFEGKMNLDNLFKPFFLSDPESFSLSKSSCKLFAKQQFKGNFFFLSC